MQHRHEIDGLRALAVVPVLLFHAGFHTFSGGFVGVDLFFVISGYLITGIILSAQQKGNFSLLGFYERRARRILPVLFFIILCCIPFAFAVMLPMQMIDFGRSVMAVCLFVSNILFWQDTGYFSASSEMQPLLHTWSLAVEEQFYLVFPLILMATARLPQKTRIAIVGVMAAASLALSQIGTSQFPSGNFYLPLTRAWELFAGSFCAFALQNRQPWKSTPLSALGIGLIVLSIVAYDQMTPYPSLYTLVPVGGAALVILCAGSGTITAKLLSMPVMTGIGLISYSLYLWHQPLFAFARIASMTEPSPGLMSGLLVAAVGLSILSWRFVETPFRKKPATGAATPARIVGIAGIACAIMIAIGFSLTLGNGLEFRVPADALAAIAVAEHPDPVMNDCLFDKGEASLDHPVRACLTPHSTSSKTILIGDSHAGALGGEALRIFDRANEDLYVMAHSACVGFSGFYVSDPKYRLRCNAFFTGIEKYIDTAGIKTVIMLSRWELYVDGTAFDNGEGGVESMRPTYVDVIDRQDEAAVQDDPARKARVLQQYVSDIEAYLQRGINVVLVYPVPEAGWNVPDLVAKAAMAGRDITQFSTSAARYRERNHAVIAAFDGIGEHPNLRRVRPADLLCDTFVKARCINSLGADRIFYFDDDHLSDKGAALIVPPILAAVRSLETVTGLAGTGP